MKIVKYDKAKNTPATTTSGSAGSGSSTTINGGSASLDRTIWGQSDTGDDIDGTMTICGNVNIRVVEDLPDDDDDGDGELEEYETGGGSLYVDLTVKAKDIEAVEDLSVGRHLYINYPSCPAHSDSNKQCIGEILFGIENDISTNKNEISSLKSRVSVNEADISTLMNAVAQNVENIANNTNEINSLKNNNLTEDKIKEWINDAMNTRGNISHPIVLFSGILERQNDRYDIRGATLDGLKLTISDITNGLITLTLENVSGVDGYAYICSVNATQALSYQTNNYNNKSVQGRSAGAHWFEANNTVNKNVSTIYLREFHQGNGDNDSWESSNWFHNNALYGVNLTICGYLHILPE